MTIRALAGNILNGAISGYAGTRAMTPVTTKLAGMQSKSDQEQETKVSPGVSYNIAAQHLAARVGIALDDQGAAKVGTLFHQGLGLGAGELYVLLRRKTSLGPIPAALLTGMALFLGMDEGLTPAMGWSAPITAYPVSTHVRGFLGHLTLGLTVMAVSEVLVKVRLGGR